MGKNLVFVPECLSTNTLALEIGQQSPAKEGTVVITDHQTAGKGQRGNTWDAEPRQNLTFSLVLKPGFLPVNKQFYLNIVISLGLYDYLKEKTSDTVYIKWPNDILVHGKKISGILIENQLKGMQISNSIAGIGFNLNQNVFASPSAISLSQVIRTKLDRHAELPHLLGHIESRYLQLRQACLSAPSGDYQPLMDDYLAALY
ncbi:MAG: biotin--[acetyl-CoA-carboxylase] ligase, partial [Bacteroidota bacterium]|nr:biotin--[acetyl-CoA-carboxylase] ligase [Bacteroidota bacterium]